MAAVGRDGSVGDEEQNNAEPHDTPDLFDVDSAREDTQVHLFFQTPCCTFKCNQKFSRDDVIGSRHEAMEEDYTCENHVNHNVIRILGQL